jgi:hypothetical protein
MIIYAADAADDADAARNKLTAFLTRMRIKAFVEIIMALLEDIPELILTTIWLVAGGWPT